MSAPPSAGHVCPDGRHDEVAAAEFLGLKPATLRTWRSSGQGPSYVRAGRIWYYVDDLNSWLRSRRIAIDVHKCP